MIQGTEVRRADREAILESRILIIDDQFPNVLLLEKILQYHGYRYSRAVTDSREAIREFQEFQPDLVLLDLMMPEVDGYAILTELAQLIKHDTYLPILVITADSSQKAKQLALSLGTKDFLTKPIDATEAMLRIENLLKTRWLHRETRRQAEDLLITNGRLQATNRDLTELHSRIALLMTQADGELNDARGSRGPTLTMAPEAMLTRISELIAVRRQLEEQLRQSQKMDALGRLAAGVAHDFNNLLTVIVGYTDLLRAALGESSKAQEHAAEVSAAAGRASSLTKQLLAFSRQQIARPRVVELDEVVRQLEKMLQRILDADIELEVVSADLVYPVKVDPAQIDQVVMNLVVNARDAMPKGGHLTIATGGAELSEGEAGRIGLRPGSYAVLTVMDTGTGMDAETKTRLFEPFFTTKEKGKGTGLGLSIVHGIVSQNGGAIVVESELRKGTTFHIYLPATDEQPGGQLFVEQPQPEVSATETILLVEDDDHVRSLAREILEQAGYTVWAAASSTAALDALRENPLAVSLLLTDLVMPAMNGFDLAREMASLNPGARVLFMSGYTDGDLANRSALRPDTALLEKPFTAASLLQSVRLALT